MKERRIILCGGARPAGIKPAQALSLDVAGPHPNIHLKLAGVSHSMALGLSATLADLLEIAAYVFGADQAVSRGSPSDTGERWRRRFEFHIPVRSPALWSRPDITEALTSVLSFLSEDDYSFQFAPSQAPVPGHLYLEDLVPACEVDQVLLFSGGTDSLGGAVQATLGEEQSVALVSHRTTPRRVESTDNLASSIARRAPHRAVRHIAAWATRTEDVGQEHTQRSRPFLLATLAASVAAMLGLDRIRVYENGITSINLPVASQVVGARAARATHPQTIKGLAQLFSLVLDREFKIETPFLWRTKADILQLIKARGCGDLLPLAVSCSRTAGATGCPTHCGRCSRCIDRRFAALAAGLSEEEDPAHLYGVDLLTGERAPGEERTLVESFVQRANRLRGLNDQTFFAAFPEAVRALRHVDLPSGEAAQRLLELHQRHALEVRQVLAEGLRAHVADFQAGCLPDSCLLVLAVPVRYLQARSESTPSHPTFRLDGEVWRVAFEDRQTTLKDCIGMRHLARLLGSPEREWACEELAAAEGGQHFGTLTSPAAEASDRVSLRKYRQRLAELEDEIAEAERQGEPHTLLELREEKQTIERHLRAVTGKRGEPRLFRDEQERARQAVSVAIKRVLKDLATHHPLLRSHLERALKLGRSCVYRPSPAITWVTSM